MNIRVFLTVVSCPDKNHQCDAGTCCFCGLVLHMQQCVLGLFFLFVWLVFLYIKGSLKTCSKCIWAHLGIPDGTVA